MRWAVLAVSVVGCGRIAFNPLADASAADATTIDSFVPLQFGPATLVPISDPGANDDDVTLTDDMLEIFFVSDRAGGMGGSDVWTAQRATTADAFSAPQPITQLNSVSSEETTRVSGDGLTMYFASDRAGGAGAMSIYTSTRVDRMSAWTAPSRIVELDTPVNDAGAIPKSPAELYLVSDVDGVIGEYDLYLATRPNVGAPYVLTTRYSNIDQGGVEITPFPLGSMLYLCTDGSGNKDLYLTRQPPDVLVPLVGVNTAAEEEDPWVSPDGSVLFFASTRNGTLDLFQASAL